jgi:hypothetical protein
LVSFVKGIIIFCIFAETLKHKPMEKEMVNIPNEQYDALVAYFNETTIDILKNIRKIGRKNNDALLQFCQDNCTDETIKQ